jgi:hypothetical protein
VQLRHDRLSERCRSDDLQSEPELVKQALEDVSLVRSVVTALADPRRESETRAMLRERFGGSKATGLKALLVSAPLEGIDLSRQRDFGRDAEL